MRIGLISDTHGLLRPEAVAALQGCAQIIHAGDIGKPQVLDGLRAIAPLEAIRGNIDTADWAQVLPERLDLRIGVSLCTCCTTSSSWISTRLPPASTW